MSRRVIYLPSDNFLTIASFVSAAAFIDTVKCLGSLLATLQSMTQQQPSNSCWLCIQDINNILNSGEVPNLMRPEDLEEISGIIRPVLQAQGRAPTKLAIQAAFVDRVQQHLHLVLCMSPVGDAFR